ncbi:MAG TPA: LytTR family DNA-binding domain-containing protein [Acidobacteriota bacterium]|nr:LytTR family DNA-binding domain-containing protein [Acidobacteriota bacterium]HNG92801.1 LytTR family DNA-binding domain-containing protein [Acidobacteriota bacterium]
MNVQRVVVVDDELPARRLLSLMLSGIESVQVVGEAGTVAEAVELIHCVKPDAVFLDVELHNESGFQILDEVSGNFRVIFVTAFDRYAARAFDVSALDYVLKPVDMKRLRQAIERLSQPLPPKPEKDRKLEYDDRLLLRVNNQSKFVRIDTIKCIFADRDYSRIWTTQEVDAQTNMSLKEWEDRLPEKYFQRIHRSSIVNFEYITNVEEWFNYSFRVYLQGMSEPAEVSRRYATKLREKLK